MTLTGTAALSLSTQTFNGVTADAAVCIAVYNVPASISNLVATRRRSGHAEAVHQQQPRLAEDARRASAMIPDKFWDAGSYTVPAGNRLGVRIWAESSSGADLVVLYDHPLHSSFLQVNAE